MKTTQRQYEKISGIFPRQRGNVTIDNLTMLNAMLHVLEHGCKWRGLPSSFARLQQEQMIRINADAFSLGSTVIKVHPDGTGALKKMALSQPADPAEDGQQNCIWSPHPLNARFPPGQAGDAPEGRKLLVELGAASEPCAMIMDRAYEGDETRNLAAELGFFPVMPPKSSRTEPWEHDKVLHKKRNEAGRLFRRLKGFRRIFTRFDKLDSMFIGFIVFALIVIAIK